jgi:hypothetical protein
MSSLPALADIRCPAAFFLHGIGDGLLALPALRALTALFEGRLTLICEKSIHELLFHELPLCQVVPIDAVPPPDKPAAQACDYAFDAAKIARQAGKCDLFLSLVPWRSTSLDQLIALLAPRLTVGLSKDWDVALPRCFDQHAFCHLFGVPRLFEPTLNLDAFAGPPTFSVDARERAAQITGLFPKGCRVLAVHNDTTKRKTWDLGRLETTLRRFLALHPEFWAITLGLNGYAAREWTDLPFVPCDGLLLDTSMCMLMSAHLFLGVDSCMLHLADLCRIPTVGLFGPTRQKEFGCWFAPHLHIDGQGTMEDVQVDDVVAGLNRMASWEQL